MLVRVRGCGESSSSNGVSVRRSNMAADKSAGRQGREHMGQRQGSRGQCTHSTAQCAALHGADMRADTQSPWAVADSCTSLRRSGDGLLSTKPTLPCASSARHSNEQQQQAQPAMQRGRHGA